MKAQQNLPYIVHEDGTITFIEFEMAKYQRMFQLIEVDIHTIKTVAQFDDAFNRLGDYFFESLLQDYQAGEAYAREFLIELTEGDIASAIAVIEREIKEDEGKPN